MTKFLSILILIVYIGSPIDIIPDAIPLFGTIDDSLAGAVIMQLLTTPKKKQWKRVPNRRR